MPTDTLRICSLSVVMKSVADAQLLTRLAPEQAGVFSKADLQTALGEPHPAAFRRRVRVLQDSGILRRFTRGFYVTETFDLPTLSQRIAPDSCISFGTVLARVRVPATLPEPKVRSLCQGRPGPWLTPAAGGTLGPRTKVAEWLDRKSSQQTGLPSLLPPHDVERRTGESRRAQAQVVQDDLLTPIPVQVSSGGKVESILVGIP